MKNLGYVLLAAGFLGGAFSTSLDVQTVNWTVFATAAIVAVIGLLMIKRRAATHARSDTVLDTNRSELRESIRNIVRDVEEMNHSVDQNGQQLRDRIDQQLRTDLRRFADARESMVHIFGLQAYADIMSSFAAGERYINRVWSASADGYDEEARTYLGKASGQFAAAQDLLLKATENRA